MFSQVLELAGLAFSSWCSSCEVAVYLFQLSVNACCFIVSCGCYDKDVSLCSRMR